MLNLTEYLSYTAARPSKGNRTVILQQRMQWLKRRKFRQNVFPIHNFLESVAHLFCPYWFYLSLIKINPCSLKRYSVSRLIYHNVNFLPYHLSFILSFRKFRNGKIRSKLLMFIRNIYFYDNTCQRNLRGFPTPYSQNSTRNLGKVE